MKGTGIFVTKEELDIVKVACRVSGMFLTGGRPMGDPESGLNIKTGEFCFE